MLIRKMIFLALAYASFTAASMPVYGSELTPYRLPSEKSIYPSTQIVQQPTQESKQQDSAAQAREEYYKEFESKAMRAKKPDIRQYISEFEKKQKAALDKGNLDEAQHYLRLQSILKGVEKK